MKQRDTFSIQRLALVGMICLLYTSSPYEKGNIFNKDPLRQRKLLMHKREIMRLFAHIKQDGYSLGQADLQLDPGAFEVDAQGDEGVARCV